MKNKISKLENMSVQNCGDGDFAQRFNDLVTEFVNYQADNPTNTSKVSIKMSVEFTPLEDGTISTVTWGTISLPAVKKLSRASISNDGQVQQFVNIEEELPGLVDNVTEISKKKEVKAGD